MECLEQTLLPSTFNLLIETLVDAVDTMTSSSVNEHRQRW